MTELTAYQPVLARLNYRPQTWLLFLALSWRKGPWGLKRIQVLPEQPRWYRRLWDAIPIWLLGLRHADFALCAGTEAERHPLIGPHTVILRTCAPDVFRMKEALDSPPISEPYAVFLDEDIDKPHPDYHRLGITPPDPVLYRRELYDIFLQITKETSLPVWRSDRHRRLTPTLVRHASLVLAHSSTAISFAALWKKRIFILIPPCFQGRPEERHARAMAAAIEGGWADYITRYLGTPEAMEKQRTPDDVLAEYEHGR